MKFVTPANKSISCLPIINLGKSKKIEKYFEEAKNIKNLISKTLHEKHLIDIYNSNLKFEKDLYKSIKSEYIGSWELQTITKEIIEHKKEQINRFVFKYFPKIIIENNNQQLNSKSKNHQKYIYKKNTRSQKAISASLKYFYILRNNLNLYKSNKKDKEYKKKLFEIMIKNKKSFIFFFKFINKSL